MLELKEINKELEKVYQLLLQEKEEDLQQFKQKILQTSIKERRENGVCWYPVLLEKTKYDTGERLLVRVSRPKEHIESHGFQSGKLISFFSKDSNDYEESVNGVVNFVSDNEMLISLSISYFPDWIYNKHLGVQLLFDENSYNEMQKSMQKLIETKDEHINNLKNILLGAVDANFKNNDIENFSYLNYSQNQAVKNVLNAKQLAIIHGPPGTGKTTTLIHCISETIKNEAQVLVCAPSNAAVDLLVENLYRKNINVVRIGHPARITEDIMDTTLDVKITQHPNYTELKKLRRRSDEMRKIAGKYKRNFGQEEREQRKLLFAEARNLKKEADHLAFYISKDVLQKAQVIASTLVGANNPAIKDFLFKTVFIDEAAQGLESATWIPILKSQRVIFAGDHHQLPPTVKSHKAAKDGFETTLFEKVIQRNKADVLLTEQYRMNHEIMEFSSKQFYEDKLIANELVANHKLFNNDLVIEFIDTAGTGFTEQINNETKSTFNTEEALLLVKHLKIYFNQLYNQYTKSKPITVGIISPYKAQTVLLNKIIKSEIDLSDFRIMPIKANTVDSFQGQERDIIYISLVRSNDKSNIGFLSDVRRMNVAITRARKKLVVIGDSSTIGNHYFYQSFIDYTTQLGYYRSAFELLYEN